MLTIEVKVNGRIVGKATAVREGGDKEFGDYSVSCLTPPHPLEPVPERQRFDIHDHRRRDGAWSLALKIVEVLTSHGEAR